MKIITTWGDVCSKGLAMEVIELKKFDSHAAHGIPLDYEITLTVSQAKNLGLLEEKEE